MIRLWLLSDDGDIVKYKYQPEDDEKGIILYSRSREATKVEDDILNNYPPTFYERLHSELKKFGDTNEFPTQKTIAMF